MLDLSASQIEEIRAIFAQDFPDLEVFAFGSRIKGKAKPYSDLDLALRGSEALSIARFGRIVEAFQESKLPFRVDLVDWNRCSPAFRDLVAAQSVQILP
jgi:predicted nucleotidyltransferase